MTQASDHSNNYRWFILILGSLSNTLVVALQSMSLSVLLPEITGDLNLSLFQAGIIWGTLSLPGIFSFLLAGAVIDRFGPKRVLIIACSLLGLFGALRGGANSFSALLVTVFLFGFFGPFVSISNVKNIGIWFEDHEFGLANGITALGMALGFFLGSMISASFISPWMGGWRETFILYGIIAAAFSIPWIFTRTKSVDKTTPSLGSGQDSDTGNLRKISKIRTLWLLGLAMLAINGAVQGLLGYLPLYLRGIGWEAGRADSLAASFHLASMVFVIPITLLSDKLGMRKRIVIIAASIAALSIGLIFFLRGNWLWGAVLAAGFARDAMMAIMISMTVQTKGVGKAFAGLATGFVLIFAGIGSLISPPLGNALGEIAPNVPFLFWGVLCAAGVISVAAIAESSAGKAKKELKGIR